MNRDANVGPRHSAKHAGLKVSINERGYYQAGPRQANERNGSMGLGHGAWGMAYGRSFKMEVGMLRNLTQYPMQETDAESAAEETAPKTWLCAISARLDPCYLHTRRTVFERCTRVQLRTLESRLPNLTTLLAHYHHHHHRLFKMLPLQKQAPTLSLSPTHQELGARTKVDSAHMTGRGYLYSEV